MRKTGSIGSVFAISFASVTFGQSNIDPADKHAWGENIGWVNFDTASAAPDQARFDSAASRFRGYAWGENVGWINLDDPASFVAVIQDSVVPALSDWAMMVLVVLCAVAGMLVLRNRRIVGG